MGSIARPSGLDRVVLPSGSIRRGASGTYTPDLSGADINPYPGALHGLTDGKNWGDVRLVSNRLHGTTISAGPPYDDSICVFPVTCGDDVRITATIYRGPNNTAASSQEIELVLCAELGPYWARFYEVFISVHGSNLYTDIVRWNGGGGNVIANYTFLKHETASPVIANGNIFRATKAGNTLTAALDTGGGFSTITSANIVTDPAETNLYGPQVYTRGLPGVGFFQRGGAAGNLLEFGLTNVQIETA